MIRKFFCALNLSCVKHTWVCMYSHTHIHTLLRERCDWWRCSSGMHLNTTPLIFASTRPPLAASQMTAPRHPHSEHLKHPQQRTRVGVHLLLSLWQIDSAAAQLLLSPSVPNTINPATICTDDAILICAKPFFFPVTYWFLLLPSRLTCSSWKF